MREKLTTPQPNKLRSILSMCSFPIPWSWAFLNKGNKNDDSWFKQQPKKKATNWERAIPCGTPSAVWQSVHLNAGPSFNPAQVQLQTHANSSSMHTSMSNQTAPHDPQGFSSGWRTSSHVSEPSGSLGVNHVQWASMDIMSIAILFHVCVIENLWYCTHVQDIRKSGTCIEGKAYPPCNTPSL